MNYQVDINGIFVDATFTEENIQGIFIPFLQKLAKLQEEKQKRILVMFAAPPGCGKTTLLHFLQKLSSETEGLKPVTIIGMDGFHRYQEYLLNHTTIREGKEIPMVQIKGAPITFDLEKLTDAVRKVAAGEKVSWPEYNRMTHNPQENAIQVEGDIVLLEGNYLLLEEEGWKNLCQYADLTVKLVADLEHLRKRLVERQYKSGKTYEDAVAFVEYSDLYNAKICLEHSLGADLEWKVKEDNSFLEMR